MVVSIRPCSRRPRRLLLPPGYLSRHLSQHPLNRRFRQLTRDVARLEHDHWQWRYADWKRRDDARNESVRQMEEVEAADARRLAEARAAAEQQRQAEVDAFRVIKETIARDRPSRQEIERAVEQSGVALPTEY